MLLAGPSSCMHAYIIVVQNVVQINMYVHHACIVSYTSTNMVPAGIHSVIIPQQTSSISLLLQKVGEAQMIPLPESKAVRPSRSPQIDNNLLTVGFFVWMPQTQACCCVHLHETDSVSEWQEEDGKSARELHSSSDQIKHVEDPCTQALGNMRLLRCLLRVQQHFFYAHSPTAPTLAATYYSQKFK